MYSCGPVCDLGSAGYPLANGVRSLPPSFTELLSLGMANCGLKDERQSCAPAESISASINEVGLTQMKLIISVAFAFAICLAPGHSQPEGRQTIPPIAENASPTTVYSGLNTWSLYWASTGTELFAQQLALSRRGRHRSAPIAAVSGDLSTQLGAACRSALKLEQLAALAAPENKKHVECLMVDAYGEIASLSQLLVTTFQQAGENIDEERTAVMLESVSWMLNRFVRDCLAGRITRWNAPQKASTL
jgi:hypothetical protein